MTTFITSRPGRSTPRPPTLHDYDCPRPGWRIQAQVWPTRRLLAYCAGCTAVRTVATPPAEGAA